MSLFDTSGDLRDLLLFAQALRRRVAVQAFNRRPRGLHCAHFHPRRSNKLENHMENLELSAGTLCDAERYKSSLVLNGIQLRLPGLLMVHVSHIAESANGQAQSRAEMELLCDEDA